MQAIITVIDNVSAFVSILGFSLSAVFFAYAGILFIISTGDPQKVAQARSALVGAFVGTVIVGVGFLFPGIVSRVIVEPAGGQRLHQGVSQNDCDGLLRQQLVAQRNATTPFRIGQVINHVQARYESCGSDLWQPEVQQLPFTNLGESWSSCGIPAPGNGRVPTIGVMVIPPGLIDDPEAANPQLVQAVVRDGSNNILILWSNGELTKPWDKSNCWVYFALFDTWRTS